MLVYSKLIIETMFKIVTFIKDSPVMFEKKKGQISTEETDIITKRLY